MAMELTGQKMYVVYDERAALMGTDEASVLLATESRREAINTAREDRGVVAEYDVTKQQTLINEDIIFYP